MKNLLLIGVSILCTLTATTLGQVYKAAVLISASEMEVTKGETVWLLVCETNIGNMPLSMHSVTVEGVTSEPWVTYIELEVGDTWLWDFWVVVNETTTYTVSGYGGARDEVTVTVKLDPPVVGTWPATEVTKTSATLNGILIDDSGEECQYRFRYREEKSDYLYTPWTGTVTSDQSFCEPISGLNPNTTYYFNAQARNSAGESDWGNEQLLVSNSIDFEIVLARMVDFNQLGIDIKVRFPSGFSQESPRKVYFWANVNGIDVTETCDISSLVGPGETAIIQWGKTYPSGNIGTPLPTVINFKSKGVPRFEDYVAFRLHGMAYWEGGQYSAVHSVDVNLPLPAIVIHGYTYTHEKWLDDKLKFFVYDSFIGFLKKNGYVNDSDSSYRTLWGPIDCQYEADKVTQKGIYKTLDSWVQRALKKEDGTPRTYADKVDIIGHSTGGLVARYYAGRASTVNKVISVGTPHLGLIRFYKYAFEYSSREQAERLLRVDQHDPDSEENLMCWFEPKYRGSSLFDENLDEVPEPYENNFNPDYNSNVDYLSIYTNHCADTPYGLIVKKTKKDWYEILHVIYNPGDGTVPEVSASDFAPDGLGPVDTELLHGSLCEDPNVQKRVFDFLSGK